MDVLVAGVDVGTTNVKAAVYERAGRLVASASAPTPVLRPAPGRAEHDAEALWEAAVGVLRAVLADVDRPERVAGVAVASMAEAGVPLDAHGAATYPVIAWHDRRSAAQSERMAEALGAARAQAVTGLRPQPIYGLCKLAWLAEQEPESYARTRAWLNVADYVAWRLCGERATDFSLASRTWALDLRAGAWSDELLDAAGVDRSLFAPLVASGTAVGRVTADAAAATGLPQSCVVAVGGHDHPCGALAAGVVRPDRALDSIGTAESLFVPLAAPVDVPPGGPSQGVHVASGAWYAASGIHAGGASLDWAVRLMAGGDRDGALEAAGAVPPGARGVCYAPHLALPGVVEERPGVLAGLNPGTDGPAIVRAVVEGLAVAAADALDRLLALTGSDPSPQVCVIGGGARNRLLLTVKAAVAGRPLARPAVAEAAALGAALLGGVGAGVHADTAAAAAAVDVEVETVPCEEALAAAYSEVVPRLRALRRLGRA